MEDTVETAQLLLAHVVDLLAYTVGTVQRQYRPRHGLTVIAVQLQRRDVCQKHVPFDFDPHAVDARFVGPHQLRQVKVFGVTRERDARHFIHTHTEQLRRSAIGRHDGATHVDGQNRKFQRTQQGVEFHMPTFARH